MDIKPDKLTLSAQDFVKYCDEQGFVEYPLHQRHLFTVDTLSRPDNAPEHHDPFDRLLISQAKSDELAFLTHDSLIPYYNEPALYLFRKKSSARAEAGQKITSGHSSAPFAHLSTRPRDPSPCCGCRTRGTWGRTGRKKS